MTRRATAPVGGVLLAAGQGRRLGRPKALVRLGGSLLVERGVRLLRDGGCAPVIVVVGAAADRVREDADLGAAEVVLNPAWPGGMGTSLRVGLAAMEGRADAAVVALVDQPLVTPLAVRRLVAAWRDGATAVVATYAGAQRNPVVLDAGVWGPVSVAAEGDAGARAWLRANPGLVTTVPCEDAGDPSDLDTPSDLTALDALLQEQPWSSSTPSPSPSASMTPGSS